jgi:enoyl-CoA hydratase/carnithine racemase
VDDAAVLVEDHGSGVRVVTLNRPRVRNAMTRELTAAWTAALQDIEADPTARVVVLTGAGSAFCAGADLSWLDQAAAEDTTPDLLRERLLPFYRAWLRPREMALPVVAAVQGPAIGAGLCLALACDVRHAGHDTVFAAPFIHLGTHAGMAATWLLPEAVGIVRAREMLYTGREVRGQECVDWGLASTVGPDPLEAALATAERIAAAAPIATRLTKAGLRERSSYEATLQWEGLAQPIAMSTHDMHEGIEARRERRTPHFEGR